MANYDDYKKQLVKAYQDLLEVQYHDKPKAKATIKLHVETLLANMLMWKLRDECLNVDVSVGVQLDQVGEWVGVNRNFSGQKFEGQEWFGFVGYDNLDGDEDVHGFSSYDTFDEDEGGVLTYNWILAQTNKLNDDDFRFLIKLKIIKNNTNMTAKNIDESIYKLFENIIYTTWNGEVMTLTYNYPNERTSIMELAKQKNVLPAPSGVEIKLQEY